MLLPGFFVAKLILRGEREWIDIIGISLGISISIVSLLLIAFFATGVPATQGLFLTIAISAVGIAFVTLRQRGKQDLVIRFRKANISFLILLVAYSILLLGQFIEYPIFPSSPSGDFTEHLKQAISYLTLSESPLDAFYPPGVHMIIASALLLVPSEGIIVQRMAMGILGVLALFALYSLGSVFFKSWEKKLLIPLFYVIVGSHWYGGQIGMGLYANFVIDVIWIILLSLTIYSVRENNLKVLAILPVLSFALLITHFTSVIYMLILFLFYIVVMGFPKRERRNYTFSLAAIVAPAVVLVPVGMHQILRIIGDITTPYSEMAAGFVGGWGLTLTGTIVGGFSRYLDFLTYQLGEPLFLALVICLPIGLYFAVKENNKWILFPFLWLVVISFLAPNNDFAWRFASIAIIPSIIILAYLSGEFLSKSRKISRYITVLTPRTITAIFFITLILWVPMATVTMSYIAGASGDGASYSRPEDRRDILSAFVWMRENVPSDAIIAGTGDWRYYYAETISSIGPPFGRSVSDSRNQLEMLSSEIAGSGPRIETQRSPSEILEEIRVITGHLLTLGDIADDAEKIYTDYASTYEELKARLVQVSDNKNQALSELEGRSQVWQNSMEHLLEEVNPIYQGILSRVESTGLIRLVQSDDIEKAGLELLVGFRGSEATVLDAYSQSGGERSLATTAFLLALQQGVISPIRAVDEFDVHLDPRNREAVFRMIFESLQKSQRTEGQYILITPGQITVVDPKVNILLVQNAYGKSKTRKVESSG